MESADFANMRQVMVESQLRPSGVSEGWVLAAMGSVPREDFVSESLRPVAYMDRSIVQSDGATLNPPVTTGLMLQAADIGADDVVLLIGAAQGYTERLLSQSGATVHVMEVGAALPDNAYSVIYIDGAVEDLPESVLASAQENARIVTGRIERGVTSLAHGIVRNGKVALRNFADGEIAVLPAFARKPEFVF